MTTSLNKIHRRVWHDHYGDIPFDENGISYEIHHINGNHHDNRIENLACLSISEHYDVHYKQGDLFACESILTRAKGYLEKPKIAYKKELHPMFGKHHSKETREKISKSHHDVSGDKNPMFGKTHTEETKKKISNSKQGRPGAAHTEETKQKLSKARTEYWKAQKKSRTKQIMVNNKTYESAEAAADELKIHPVNIRRRCRMDKYTDWKYV